MKFNHSLASLAAAAALLVAPLASQADVLQVRISDGINSLLISDNGAGDASTTAGIVSYTASNLWGNWDVTFSLGTSSYNPLDMHLTAAFSASLSNFGSGESKVLTIELTQTGLSSGAGTNNVVFGASGGGSGTGGTTASWAAFADDADSDVAAAFGTGTAVFSAVGFSTQAGGTTASMTDFYSATLRTVFDITGATGPLAAGSLDLNMSVPEPGTIALAGLALLGLGLARRRQA